MKSKVIATAENIKKLKSNNVLPNVSLLDVNKKPVNLKDLLTKKP